MRKTKRYYINSKDRKGVIMEYITTKEAAEAWDVSERMVRKYCEQGKIEGVIHVGNLWIVPIDATCPNNVDRSSMLRPLAQKVVNQKRKNNHFGIYEYLQVNLAYSSCRMASNRLTRDQVQDIYRRGKVSVAFEPMKVDDVIEISNHFRAGGYMVDTIADPITTIWLLKIHYMLFRGTKADQEETIHIAEYRTKSSKFGVAATTIPAALRRLLKEYESKRNIALTDILDFHARFEAIHPFEDGNGRVGRLLMVKECLRHGIDPFIIDDKHRGEYNRGIAQWTNCPSILIEVAGKAQDRFRNQKETLDLMEYYRPTTGRGSR